MTIFISIASYRDPELEPTIEDCLAKARHPEQLTFGVCWQHGPEETAPRRFSDAGFRVVDVDWRKSRGACWARAEAMKLWRGEDWFLQLDSHHRFVSDWDVKLIAQAEATGSAKPILTTYPPAYSLTGDPASFGDEPTLMVFDGFFEDGLPSLKPMTMPRKDWGGKPVASRFLAAGFLFAPGRFVEDVPYDPDLYFIGEEITLAVRAFTRGYEIFSIHPRLLSGTNIRGKAARNTGAITQKKTASSTVGISATFRAAPRRGSCCSMPRTVPLVAARCAASPIMSGMPA